MAEYVANVKEESYFTNGRLFLRTFVMLNLSIWLRLILERNLELLNSS